MYTPLFQDTFGDSKQGTRILNETWLLLGVGHPQVLGYFAVEGPIVCNSFWPCTSSLLLPNVALIFECLQLLFVNRELQSSSSYLFHLAVFFLFSFFLRRWRMWLFFLLFLLFFLVFFSFFFFFLFLSSFLYSVFFLAILVVLLVSMCSSCYLFCFVIVLWAFP